MDGFRRGKQNRRSQWYSRFPDAEFDRRESRAREMMEREGLDALLCFGGSGFTSHIISYLTNYRPHFPTYFALFRDERERSTLFVGISNHLQYVREVSVVEDLRLQLPDPPLTISDRLDTADQAVDTLGIVGFDPRYELTIPYSHYDVLRDELDANIVDATVPFLSLVSVKSEAELNRIREAAAITDRGMRAIRDNADPGRSERAIRDALDTACRTAGGSASLAFISSAPMTDADPGECLPWKRPADRTIGTGDVITTEISATYDGYSSQLHRPFAVGAPPTDTYEELYAVTRDAYTRMVDALEPGNTVADVYDAITPVENSPFKIYDVLLHGYGNGYIHPFVGTNASNYWPGAPDPVTESWEFSENMVVVVQPNVVTQDERHGLQFGTTVIVTENGPEIVHDFPERFEQV